MSNPTEKHKTEDFLRMVARLFIPSSHLARVVHHVHDHVELEIR